MPKEKVIKKGHYFKDPEARYTLDGNPVATCPLCKNEYHIGCMTNTDDNFYVCESECWDDFLEHYRNKTKEYEGVNFFTLRARTELNLVLHQ